MICQISITRDGERIFLDTPYSPGNRKLWTALNGKYNGIWQFHPSRVVQKALDEKFGVISPLCQVQFTSDDPRIDKSGATWQLGGYVLATKRTHVGETLMPEGVELIEGEWANVGGTSRQPTPAPLRQQRLTFLVVIRKSFADLLKMDIVEEDDTVDPVLQEYTSEALEQEIVKRRA